MRQLIFILLLITSSGGQAQNGKFIETNGVKLYYEIHGTGEVLLLLHGNTMTHDMWTPWLDDLSKNYKVITVDMRGHGQSNNPTNTFSHKESAIDFYGLLDKLEVDEFKAMGFSSGSLILTHMATMDTTRIQSLILIGASPYYPVSSRAYMRGLTYESIAKNNPDWMEYMKNVQPGGEKQIRSVLNNYVQAADSYDDMNFTTPYLSTINCPTLIIHGDRDPLFSVDIPVSSFKAIPKSYLWIIPNFKHSTPWKGTPLGTIFIDTVSQFLTGNWND